MLYLLLLLSKHPKKAGNYGKVSCRNTRYRCPKTSCTNPEFQRNQCCPTCPPGMWLDLITLAPRVWLVQCCWHKVHLRRWLGSPRTIGSSNGLPSFKRRYRHEFQRDRLGLQLFLWKQRFTKSMELGGHFSSSWVSWTNVTLETCIMAK